MQIEIISMQMQQHTVENPSLLNCRVSLPNVHAKTPFACCRTSANKLPIVTRQRYRRLTKSSWKIFNGIEKL